MISLFGINSSKANINIAYDYSFKDLDGEELKLSDFKNKVIVITNVASKCGFTSQYEDLQTIWEKYQEKGLVVIGVPSSSFNQEFQTNEEVKNFCEAKFGISFPMTQKEEVRGANAWHPFCSVALMDCSKDDTIKFFFGAGTGASQLLESPYTVMQVILVG